MTRVSLAASRSIVTLSLLLLMPHPPPRGLDGQWEFFFLVVVALSLGADLNLLWCFVWRTCSPWSGFGLCFFWCMTLIMDDALCSRSGPMQSISFLCGVSVSGFHCHLLAEFSMEVVASLERICFCLRFEAKLAGASYDAFVLWNFNIRAVFLVLNRLYAGCWSFFFNL